MIYEFYNSGISSLIADFRHIFLFLKIPAQTSPPYQAPQGQVWGTGCGPKLRVFLFGFCFVADNYLCMSKLINIRAANGEHGELGSGWCSGSYIAPTCCMCVWFRSVLSMYWDVLWTALPSESVPCTLGLYLWTAKIKRLCSCSYQTVLVNFGLCTFTRTTEYHTIVFHVASSGEPWMYKVH